MQRFDGERPQNARININYSGTKPKVSFSYPRKKGQGTVGNMLRYILFGWILLNIPLLIYINPTGSFSSSEYKPLGEYNISDIDEFLEYYLQPERIYYYHEYYNNPLSFKNLSLKSLLFLCYFFLTPLVIYFPFKKRWNKLYPDFQAFITTKKYRKFTRKDLEKDKKGNSYVELPVFKNVVCDFNATKDFSKYLKEFDIREHNFKAYRLRKFRKEKRKKRPQNEYIWYARWYFTQEPKKGELEVIFK